MIVDVELALAKREYSEALRAFEKHVFELAYLDSRLNKVKTAARLGISRVTLYTKLKEYELL